MLRITGGKPLDGRLEISGRKNAALKLIAAAALSDQDVTLTRVPDIADVRTMLDILEAMGAVVDRSEPNTVTINCASISDPTIPHDLGRKLRASLVLVGPLLGRFGRATFPHPGGCVIGKRTITPHLKAFEQLGATIDFDGTTYTIRADELRGKVIYLKEKSVTGTENLIMAATRAYGPTTVLWAAEESHITNLCDLLREMGYRISGDGSSTVIIDGLPDHIPQEARMEIIADEIEVGTFAVATLVTRGHVRLEKVGSQGQIVPILSQLEDMGAEFSYEPDTQTLELRPSNLVASRVQTNPWPGFPPDLQSPFTVLATQATGTTLVQDWMYEGRLYFVDLLQKMGANIVICDPHRALVMGPTQLYRASSITPDLRAGAALVVAALAADGESEIEHAELIDRGYANLEERLGSLGAQIIREA
jgi:UDP-N-acetylglucosamine 1-carboxyvinyltransferase